MLKPEAALRKDVTSSYGEMQHRHFATVAAILRDIAAPADVVEAFADKLRHTNHKFDRARFLRAVREG